MEAIFKLALGSPKEAGDAKKILESEKIGRRRSSATFSVSGKTLVIRLRADDVPALRASANTYLRLAGAILTAQRARA